MDHMFIKSAYLNGVYVCLSVCLYVCMFVYIKTLSFVVPAIFPFLCTAPSNNYSNSVISFEQFNASGSSV